MAVYPANFLWWLPRPAAISFRSPYPAVQWGGKRDHVAAAAAGDTGGGTTAPAKQATDGTPSADASAQADTVHTYLPIPTIEEYARRWSAGDYDGLYDLLSADVRSIERQDFVDATSRSPTGPA